jgi:HEAT repeat protein
MFSSIIVRIMAPTSGGKRRLRLEKFAESASEDYDDFCSAQIMSPRMLARLIGAEKAGRKLPYCWWLMLVVSLTLCSSADAIPAQTYTLVQGLEKFEGSTAAWHLMEKNGFVVADPAFKQIFEPYLDDSMPVFITPDSAWHAYHVLLEEGMQELDTTQSRRLVEFSRRLWTSANEQGSSSGRDFPDLARFAGIGLALQDETFRKSLPDDQKRLIDSLLEGKGEVRPEIGFPLWAPAFHESGHDSSAEWAGYVAARQWYATVDFRLSDARETRLALCLSWLINKDPDLLQAWRQLSDPWEAMLAPAQGGSVGLYWDSAGKSLGANFTLATLLKNAAALQSRLTESLPKPRYNDQWLPAEDRVRFSEVINGFRLLPPRHLPSEICSQNTSDPQIPGRTFPSGLDFFVAATPLRFPAAQHALEAAEGSAVLQAVRKTPGGPPENSLRGRALRLLAALQEPLPERMAPALRSEAWADAQLWTQLGAWAEEEHAGDVRRAPWVEEGAILKPSAGVVAPYPEFFAGLGKLAMDTAVTLEKAGIDEPFDSKTVARKLLEGILWREGLGTRSQEESDRMAGLVEQFNQFLGRSLQPHQGEAENDPPASQKVINDLEALARRCSNQTAPADADRAVLLSFFQERQTVPKMLRDFKPVCDKLAELARKHLEGTALTEGDSKWIADYGTTLAHFQSYSGTSADTPRDDFPIVNLIQSNPRRAASFYTALGRPQALYIILPSEGKLRLFRGAVMSYREFVRTNADSLNDESWRALARTGEVPPPPPFTESFRAERDAAELIKLFSSINPDTQGYKEITEALEELQSRVTDRDVPELIDALGKTLMGQQGPASQGIASAITKLHWESHQRELLALLERNDGEQARMIAPILLQRPEGLDAVFLRTNFEHAPAPARRVYCALLSHLPQTDQTRGTILRALSDPAPAVRLEAATVLGAGGSGPEKTAALLERLNDDNEYVTAAAVAALGQLNATNTAPALLTNLEERLPKPELSLEDLRAQSEAARDFPLNPGPEPPRFNGARMGRNGGGFAMRPDASPARSALIEALGDLHYQPAEERIFTLLDGPHAVSAGKALKELAPERLARRLEAEACDTKADPQARDRALLLLGTAPANSSATGLIPLLDDTTVVPGRRPLPGREWRICDRAATTISTLLGRPVRIMPNQPTEQRDQQIEQVRQALKSAY